MPYCYYTCNLVPTEFLSRSGYEPLWFGAPALDEGSSGRYDSPNVHPMTCPFVTRLVTSGERLLSLGSGADRVVVPGGCDAMRRAGDLLASQYPEQVRTFRLPRLSDEGALRELTRELEALAEWLENSTGASEGPAPEGAPGVGDMEVGRREAPADRGGLTAGRGDPQSNAQLPGLSDEPGGQGDDGRRDLSNELGGRENDGRRGFDLPTAPRPGGVFVVGGPMSDESLLRLIEELGGAVSGVESCTAPSRWMALDGPPGGPPGDPSDGGATTAAEGAGVSAPTPKIGDKAAAAEAARLILKAGVCPRRSLVDRREYLVAQIEAAQPSSVIYARQSFCDPGAYDALLAAQLAAERGLPFLEVEVGFPLEVSGPLRTRVEAFLEAQLLDDDLHDIFDDEDW